MTFKFIDPDWALSETELVFLKSYRGKHKLQCALFLKFFQKHASFPSCSDDFLRGGPTSLDRFAAKLSYKSLVCVMPLVRVFVPLGEGRSPRREEQSFVHHKPHLGFVH